eukprot:NODE_11911_length_531_cov_35.377451_g11623_i0.p1 GENE.NODE_11911_length_531_cov_35.377451_g11623_i0~~NODE_11911_length_531_cov_35.377451_g11623_i0.p1  ORF type:complete len:137 (-),score=49.51 NODE_11911_length_531_cov_35.377451_g11623_i0:119-478(-)
MAFKSAAVFDVIKAKMSPDAVKNVGVVFQFDITNSAGDKKSWVVDAKNGSGSVKEGTTTDASCTISIGDDDYIKLLTGELSGMQAFMSGKMKVKGNVMQAQKLQKLMDPKEAKAQLSKL